MKRLVLASALAVGAVGCEPEVAQDAAPAPQTVVLFEPSASPPIVPSPNDIAIITDPETGRRHVNAPIDPNASPAQQEFTRDYINTLNGFPQTASASAQVSKPLVPASVTPATVRVLPLNAPAAAVYSPTVTAGKITPTIAYDANTNRITVTPNGAWPKGSRWAVAVLGGANGVQSADGSPVGESSTFTLLKSSEPLANCPVENGAPNYASPDCTLGTNLIPSNVFRDPQGRFEDQLATATRLEQIRAGYAQVFTALAALPGPAAVQKENVVLLWTWTTVAQAEPAFDPAGTTPLGRILPFPTNLALAQLPDGGVQVALPTTGATGSQLQLLQGLNTLDGFSTTAPIVTENTDSVPALVDGVFVTADGGVVENGALIAQAQSAAEVKTTPSAFACVNCRSNPSADGGVQQVTLPDGGVVSLQQLQIVPSVPLDERSVYVAALSTDAKATVRLNDGSTVTDNVMAPAAWALMRMKNPIADANGKSLVSGVPDANANALEPIRKGFQTALDAVESSVPRSKMAMGTVFNTQSTVSVLKQLQQLPLNPALPAVTGNAFYMEKIAPGTRGVPATLTSVDVYFGSAFFPIAVNTATGTLNPTSPAFQRAPFVLTVPTGDMPSAGFPITQFGHGLGANRTSVYAVASALAGEGRAALAFDTLFHGERSLCVGSAPLLRAATGNPSLTDDNACAVGTCDATTTSPTFGRCINTNVAARATCQPFTAAGDTACAVQRQGVCLPAAASPTGGICEGGDFARAGDSATAPDPIIPGQDPRRSPPVVSGNILNVANLFATRDNFRHQVVDLSQMLRVARNDSFEANLKAASGNADLLVNTAQIDYLGQSLGGILGTLYTSASPDVQKSTLNAPGGDLIHLVQNSRSAQIQALYGGLKQGLAAGGTNEGTPSFDTFINFARWILDPADPQNVAVNMKNGANKPAGRDVLIQYITEDQTVPNESTLRLIAAANRPLVGGTNNQCKVSRWNPPFTDPRNAPASTGRQLRLADRHSFLTNFAGNGTVTTDVQSQAVTFLDSGTVTALPADAQ